MSDRRTSGSLKIADTGRRPAAARKARSAEAPTLSLPPDVYAEFAASAQFFVHQLHGFERVARRPHFCPALRRRVRGILPQTSRPRRPRASPHARLLDWTAPCGPARQSLYEQPTLSAFYPLQYITIGAAPVCAGPPTGQARRWQEGASQRRRVTTVRDMFLMVGISASPCLLYSPAALTGGGGGGICGIR